MATEETVRQQVITQIESILSGKVRIYQNLGDIEDVDSLPAEFVIVELFAEGGQKLTVGLNSLIKYTGFFVVTHYNLKRSGMSGFNTLRDTLIATFQDTTIADRIEYSAYRSGYIGESLNKKHYVVETIFDYKYY